MNVIVEKYLCGPYLHATRAARLGDANDANKISADMAWRAVGVTPAQLVQADTEVYEAEAMGDYNHAKDRRPKAVRS